MLSLLSLLFQGAIGDQCGEDTVRGFQRIQILITFVRISAFLFKPGSTQNCSMITICFSDIPMSVGIIDPRANPNQLNTVEFLWDPAKRTSVFIQVRHCRQGSSYEEYLIQPICFLKNKTCWIGNLYRISVWLSRADSSTCAWEQWGVSELFF